MSLARLCLRMYAISGGVRRVLIGQITARAAGIAWYASAIIGLQREVHRLVEGTGVGRDPGYERVWSENRDSILRLDTELDEGICEVLHPLSPGG